MNTLVDSSIWIKADHIKNPEHLKLKRLIKSNSAFITRFIQTEISQGARAEEEFHMLWNGFLGLPYLEITDSIFKKSAYHFYLCRKKGITPTTLDCLLATCALEYNMHLWSADRDFKKMQKVFDFKLIF